MKAAIALCIAASLWVPAMPAASPAALEGIAHVALRVSDLGKSREFYKALGFEESFMFADPGKAPVSYMKVNDTQFIELYGRVQESQPLGLMHICYEAADINALYDEYVRRGLEVRAPTKARAGNMLFSIHDPEGQLLEYTMYLPGSLHSEDRGKHLGEHRVASRLIGAAMAVRDVAAEREFFVAKLGFRDAGVDGSIQRLRLPGTSGAEIEMEPAAGATKARVVFAVADLGQTLQDLQGRGVTAAKKGGAVLATDPDGAALEFRAVPGAPAAGH